MNSASSSSQAVEPVFDTLVIPNRLDELTTVSDWINGVAGQHGISAEITFRLDLVLTEAVTNVIKYAYDDDETHTITISLQFSESMFSIELSDDGRPFDPTRHPEVTLPRSLKEAGEGGLGIHLIRNYTDEYHYRRQDNNNILTMIIYNALKN